MNAKLHDERDFIREATRGGYNNPFPDNCDYGTADHVLLDPLAWEAVGKARGWLLNDKGEISEEANHYVVKIYSTRWFETRISRGDMGKFWESLK